MELKLQTKKQSDKTKVSEFVSMMTLDTTNYWTHRVQVSPTQAIVGFPKFFTTGIGFENEEDWNTNLPYTSTAEKILSHIWHNRGKANKGHVFRARCIAAIEMIQISILSSKAQKR